MNTAILGNASQTIVNNISRNITKTVVGGDPSKQKIADLKKKQSNLTKQYNKDLNKLTSDRQKNIITEDEFNNNSQKLQKQYNDNNESIQTDIKNAEDEYNKKNTKGYKPIKKAQTSLQKNIASKRKGLKSSNSKISGKLVKALKTTSVSAIAATALGMALNSLAGKNAKISKMVNKTNELVDKANGTQIDSDKQLAQNSINSTVRAIQESERKLQQIQSRLSTYKTVVNVAKGVSLALKVALDALFSSPAPIKPAAKTVSDAIDKLVQIVFSLGNVVNLVVPTLITSMLNNLKEQRNRLKTLEGINNSNTPTTENELNLPTVGLSEIKSAINTINTINEILGNSDENNLNVINNLNISDFNNELSNNNNEFTLGEIPDQEYKGFRFVLKEEVNGFTIAGRKRKFATIINQKGHELLKTEPSFTLQPDILIEELKLEIDRQGLTS